MKILDLEDIVERNGKGVRAYLDCSRQARENIRRNPDLAVFNFLLAVAADQFIDTYEDQPLLSQTAGREFDRFSGFVETLESAASDRSSELQIRALNDVALAIAESGK